MMESLRRFKNRGHTHARGEFYFDGVLAKTSTQMYSIIWF
jgi:hypothetical protein